MHRKIVLLAFILLGSALHNSAQTLNEYLQLGVKNSPLIKDFKNQLLSGRLDSLLIHASYKPQINQVSQLMKAPFSNTYGYDEAITNGANYSALVNLIQPLLNKRIKTNQIQENSLSRQGIQADLKLTENELKEGITSQYLSAYADLEQLTFNQRIEAQLIREQELLKPLVNKGIYAQTDAMNLALAISNVQIACKQSKIQYYNSLALLNYICGIPDTAKIVLEPPVVTLKNEFIIQNTPSMVRFKVDSLKTENYRQTIGLNYRPRINAFADAGVMAIAPQNISHNLGTSFGVNLSIPIYDGKQRKLQLEKLKLAENSRIDYQTFYTKQYWQQVGQLRDQLTLTEDLINRIQLQLGEQEKLIEIYGIEIEKGMVRFLDYLAVVNSYTQTKINLVLAELSRLQIINQMNYLK